MIYEDKYIARIRITKENGLLFDANGKEGVLIKKKNPKHYYYNYVVRVPEYPFDLTLVEGEFEYID